MWQLLRVAVEVEEAVGGVVVLAVEVGESFVGQVGDSAGVAARVDGVDGVVLVERLPHRLGIGLVGGGVDAFHLVVDDAAVLDRGIHVVGHVVPPLLLEDAWPSNGVEDARVEAGVQVDVDQVEEVLLVLAGDRVHGLVGSGHGAEERLEAALEQVDEWLLARVALRAAEHAVLEDVRHARVVLWQRAEVGREDLVRVRCVHQHHLRARRLVRVHADGDASLGHLLRPLQNKLCPRRGSHI